MNLNALKDNDIVCFCFNHTRADIENDVKHHDGNSSIMEAIMAEKKAGGCNCKNTNPKGR